MEKLITICKNENEANHLAFLLGIPSTLVLPYYDVKCIESMNPEAVGGFVTLIKPYPVNVIELRESLMIHPAGINLINLEFDNNGICNELRSITERLNSIFSKYLARHQFNNQFELNSLKSELRKLFDDSRMTLDRGFDFEVIDTIHRYHIRAKSNPFELFLKLVNKYK
jgi:hypothetical protein